MNVAVPRQLPDDFTDPRELLRFAEKAYESGQTDLAEAAYLLGCQKFPDFEQGFIRSFCGALIEAGDVERMHSLIDSHFSLMRHVFWHFSERMRNSRSLQAFNGVFRRFRYKLLEEATKPEELFFAVRSGLRFNDVEYTQDASHRLERCMRSSDFVGKDGREIRFDASLLCGDAALCAGEPRSALNHYNAAAGLRKESPIPFLGAAMAMLDRGKFDACADLLGKAGSLETSGGILAKLIDHLRRQLTQRGAATLPQPPIIDLLIFSHATERMTDDNKLLAPPRTDMVANLLNGSIERASGCVLTSTLMYDHRDGQLSEDYLRNLREMTAARGVSLIVNTRNGLRRQWIDGIARTTGEFLLILEQDHELLPNLGKWIEVVDLMKRRPDVNYVRFNRRSNRRHRFDYAIYQTKRDRLDHVTRAVRFSNTPHLMRRSFYEDIVHPIIGDQAQYDKRNDGAAGVEENINKAIASLNDILGYTITSRLMGLTIWGDPGAVATTRTLGR